MKRLILERMSESWDEEDGEEEEEDQSGKEEARSDIDNREALGKSARGQSVRPVVEVEMIEVMERVVEVDG